MPSAFELTRYIVLTGLKWFNALITSTKQSGIWDFGQQKAAPGSHCRLLRTSAVPPAAVAGGGGAVLLLHRLSLRSSHVWMWEAPDGELETIQLIEITFQIQIFNVESLGSITSV